MGKIFKIRIGHDGSGIGSGWFLETVDVKRLISALVPKEKKKEDKKKKKKKKEDVDEEGGEEMQEVVLTYSFPCSRWLAGGEEDGELVVELLPDDAKELEGIKCNPPVNGTTGKCSRTTLFFFLTFKTHSNTNQTTNSEIVEIFFTHSVVQLLVIHRNFQGDEKVIVSFFYTGLGLC